MRTSQAPPIGTSPWIAASCGEVLITATHSARVFVDNVDFITTLGHGSGPGDRAAAGLTTAGPTLVITDLCTMRPDPETRELVVTDLHAGVTRDQVTRATGWPVRFAADVGTIDPPTQGELTVLRDLHARTDRAHADG